MCAKFWLSAIIYVKVIANNSFSSGTPLSPRPWTSWEALLPNKPPVSIKTLSNLFEIYKPPLPEGGGGLIEDLRYSSWQRFLNKQGYSLNSMGSDAWRRFNDQRLFADARLTQCSKPIENGWTPVFLNLFVQVSGRIWTVVGRGYFSHATLYNENLASARRVSGVWPLPPKLQTN